jgi:hypothetical protein
VEHAVEELIEEVAAGTAKNRPSRRTRPMPPE